MIALRHAVPMLVMIVSFAAVPQPVVALTVESHQLINEAAGSHPGLDVALRAQLGFLRGIGEAFRGRTVLQWLGEGGIREDDDVRFLGHFHDPLQIWSAAGLGPAPSSIRWMQSPTNVWSWQRVRAHYHTALTSRSPAERERAWADTFRGLGQLMHLVVDASVPEHVRQDAHPRESICRFLGLECAGSYEHWVSDNVPLAPPPAGFDPAILGRPTPDAAAPVPVARLIDTDTYNPGNHPNITLTGAIGIAEVANANFFSEDTFDGSYPFPSLAGLRPTRHPSLATGRARAYFVKADGEGLAVDPVAAECVLFEAATAEAVLVPDTGYCADENVWQATARIMLPLAVGYARGVLDYFFRGRIEIAPPARYAYGLATFEPGNAGHFTRLRFKIRNATAGDEPAGAGQVVAVMRYRQPVAGSIIQNPLAPLTAPRWAVSAPQTVALTREFRELVFDFSGSPIPTNAADLFLTVVYRGPLGLEADGVAAGGRDLLEPDPIDRANITDWDCFEGVHYQVALGDQILPPFDPPAAVQRDVNRDGVQDLFGPWLERGVLLKTFPAAGPVPSVSEASFDQHVPEQRHATYSRYLVLQDERFYGLAALRREVTEFSTASTTRDTQEFAVIPGVLNHLFQGPGGLIFRELTLAGVYRGLPTYRIFVVRTDGMARCPAGEALLDPPLGPSPHVIALD